MARTQLGPRPEVPMTEPNRSKITVPVLRQKKLKKERISVLTAYDATFARIFDEAGIDVLLVGDSLGMVVQGLDSTLPVTLDEMLYHTRAVARGVKSALIVGDMPFMTYQVSEERALENAGRFLMNGAHAVKLEGGIPMQKTIARLVSVGIPVMGHVGLTPQSVNAMGGFKVQGKSEEDAERVLADARAVEDGGAFAVVLEGVPQSLAARITAALTIPTIGIGAGKSCDGQVLVSYDMLGLTPNLRPKFVKRYAELFEAAKQASMQYADEVRRGEFPGAEHSFGVGEAVAAKGREGYGPSEG
jgi:3-methyl-2-oxobutanoate hydroxymethyltransferase